MLWHDTVSDILTMINGQSVYNAARTTTPGNLGLVVLNQAKDWISMQKCWRDLRVVLQLINDSDRKATLPDDFGRMLFVYTDPGNVGKPMWFYTLDDNDIARRYTEEVTQDDATGAQTRKICFPPSTYLPQNPTIVYSKTVANYTQADVDSKKICIFPMNVMLVAAKKILQDFYGVAANQDPNWINNRCAEELQLLEAYAYNNNVALDMAVHDRFGNPVFIAGASLKGGSPRGQRPSPFVPATIFTGGTW